MHVVAKDNVKFLTTLECLGGRCPSDIAMAAMVDDEYPIGILVVTGKLATNGM